MSKRFKIFITVAFTLVLLSGSVNALGERVDVTVVDNGVAANYLTYVRTAGEFFSEVGITIGPNDVVNYENDEQLSTFARNTIKIERGLTVEVVVNYVSRTIEVPGGYRVGHIIQMLKDESGQDYIYEGSLGEEVRTGQVIKLDIIGTEYKSDYVTIPYDTETIYSEEIPEGEITVVSPGSDGLKQVTTKIQLLNHMEVSREIVSEAISAPPITRIVHVGIGKPVEIIPEQYVYAEIEPLMTEEYPQPFVEAEMGYTESAEVFPEQAEATNAFVEQAMYEWGLIPTEEPEYQQEPEPQQEPEFVQEAEEVFDPDAPPKDYLKKMTMRATAYTADYASTGKNPGHPYFGKTATGMTARYGVVAVDPNVIELGTNLYIYGYGYCIAADTGGAIVGDRIDLYLNTSQECLNYGVRTVEVYILD